MGYFAQVLQSIEFMESRLRQDVSMAEIARRAGISTWHFQRIFHEAVGETVGSYLRRRRLAESLAELAGSERKVIDIALDYQFGSPEAYTRAFRAEYGFSPREYRTERRKVVPYRKPALSETALLYRSADLGKEPEIRVVDPLLVVGLRTSFVTPLAEPLAYMESVTKVWADFFAREAEIPHRIGALKIGLGEGPAAPHRHIHDDQIDYVACTPVSKVSELPAGMEAATIAGGEYAIFRATGFHRQTQLVIDYVYATWLPRSGRRRAEGPSYALVDHRVEPLDPATSTVFFHLPLEKEPG